MPNHVLKISRASNGSIRSLASLHIVAEVSRHALSQVLVLAYGLNMAALKATYCNIVSFHPLSAFIFVRVNRLHMHLGHGVVAFSLTFGQ